MKRDMETVKKILLFCEGHKSWPNSFFIEEGQIEGLSHNEIQFHLKIMTQAGLIETKEANDQQSAWYQVFNLTWQGCEFLDNAREPKVWNAAMKYAGHLSWGVFTSVLSQVAGEFATKYVMDSVS